MRKISAALFFMLIELVLFLIPRLHKNELAVDLLENRCYTKAERNDLDNYEILCDADCLEPGEQCDGICPVIELKWLCFGLFPRQRGDIRSLAAYRRGEA